MPQIMLREGFWCMSLAMPSTSSALAQGAAVAKLHDSTSLAAGGVGIARQRTTVNYDLVCEERV